MMKQMTINENEVVGMKNHNTPLVKDRYCMIYGFILTVIGFLIFAYVILDISVYYAIDKDRSIDRIFLSFLSVISILSVITGIQIIRVIVKVLPLLIITLSLYILIIAGYIFERTRYFFDFGYYMSIIITFIIVGILAVIKLHRIKKSQQSM